MIEKDPTLLEAELLETLKTKNTKTWSASENQKLLEAYETWGKDFRAISLHVGTKSIEKVYNKMQHLRENMKNEPETAMSDFLYTDSKVKRPCVKWTESEKLKFNDAVREVGKKP